MTKYVVQSSWEDAPHLTPEARADLIKSYSVHERDARTKGIPQLGSGAIYPVPESEIICDPFVLPAWYRVAYALDVGWNRTAALWGALDTESDVLYLFAEHYRANAEPAIHAAAIKARGEWIPGVIDPASRGRTQVDGTQLMSVYQELGLILIEADNAVEAGIYAVWQRLSTGRIKVFKTLQNLLGEYRIYRRDEKGNVVKGNDHLMDCARYLVRSGISVATMRPLELSNGREGMPNRPKHQIDYSPYGDAYKVNRGGDNAGRPQRSSWMPGKGFG